MSKQKNSSAKVYAMTISPKVGTTTRDKVLHSGQMYTVAKVSQIEKSAYVVEMGEKGDHPHLHMLITYKKSRRYDTVISSIQTYFSKSLDHPITPCFVDVKLAREPSYWLVEYMQKEAELKNNGYDLEHYRQLYARCQLENNIYNADYGIKLNRTCFLSVYRLLKKEYYDSQPDRLKYRVGSAAYIKHFIYYLDKKGFNVSWCFYNYKQMKCLILFDAKLNFQEYLEPKINDEFN